jgi:DNA modification methylase
MQHAQDFRWPADKVERRAISELIPYARNARTHSDAQVAQVAASMKEWGWTNPILVDETGMIIAGHCRVLAARQLGFAEGPVMVAEGWTEAQKRAYVLADNQLAMNAGWNDDMLSLELRGLQEAGFDLDLTGFGGIDALLASGTMGATDPDAAPKVSEIPISAPGDVWILGRHRLLCGNSTKEDDVRLLLGDRRSDVVFTDPPYGVAYHGSSASDTIAGDITQTAIPIAFKQALDHATTDDARLYFCGGSSNVTMYYSLFDAYLRKMPSIIIWDKGNIVLRRNNYHSQFEVIFYGWKGKGGANEYWFGPRTADCASDIWQVKRDNGADYLHPTQKPVALAQRAIGNSCPSGGVVYEPFSGSGSTIIAAEMTGRSCCALELSPVYVDVGVIRWQQFTSGTATLEATGATFAEMQVDRVPEVA